MKTTILGLLFLTSSTYGWTKYQHLKMHKPHQEKSFDHLKKHYVMMIAGGCSDCTDDSETVELFDLVSNASCYTAAMPNWVEVVGEYVNHEPLVCGGNEEGTGSTYIGRSQCYTLDPKHQIWGPAQEFEEKRTYAYGVALHDHKAWWVLGGSREYTSGVNNPKGQANPVRTSEIYHNGYWSDGPEFKYPIQGHCMVNINENETAVIGGHTDDGDEDGIMIWNWNTWSWRCGPSLADKLYYPTKCGVFHAGDDHHSTEPSTVFIYDRSTTRNPSLLWNTKTDALTDVSSATWTQTIDSSEADVIVNIGHTKLFVVTTDMKVHIMDMESTEEIGEIKQLRDKGAAAFLVPRNYAKCVT